MRRALLEHALMGGTVLGLLVVAGALPLWWLGQLAWLALGWGLLSTALVASAGAWVALGRRGRRRLY